MEMVSQLTEHHDLSPSELSREHSAENKIKAAIHDQEIRLPLKETNSTT